MKVGLSGRGAANLYLDAGSWAVRTSGERALGGPRAREISFDKCSLTTFS
jgi:hypothetical protein